VSGKPVKTWDEVNKITAVALTNVLPVAIKREGKTNTYLLKAAANEAPELKALIDLKTFNLGPRDLLIVKNIKPGSAAEMAHLQTNDEIVSFGGVPISGFNQLTNLLEKCAGHPTPLVVNRGGEPLTVEVTPATKVTVEKGRLGVNFGFSKDVYVLEHPTPWAQISDVLEQLTSTISALVHPHASSVKVSDLAGPVGIISFLAVKFNTDYRLALGFLVMLNINLAIINLLPMPVLDGGHIVMAILERIRRRPLDVRVVEYATTIFAVLLISFMLYVTFFDFRRLPLVRALFSQESQIEQTVKPVPHPVNPAP
ncbi:MAG: site-2 protease family protein, partial [Verrucomicrobiota bacterium]